MSFKTTEIALYSKRLSISNMSHLSHYETETGGEEESDMIASFYDWCFTSNLHKGIVNGLASEQVRIVNTKL